MSSSPLSAPAGTSAADTRRSGRVRKQPDFLAGGTPQTGKRKRVEGDEEEEQDDVADDDEDSASESEQEDEPAEEETRAARARKSKPAPKKPAAKKSKPNGSAVDLPIRPPTTKRPPRKRAMKLDLADAEEAGGLYTEVFARGLSPDDVVTAWLEKFNEHESRAVADVINFVLRCAGCNLQVNEHDIGEPDSCTDRLGEMQDEFQAQEVADYPIISKRNAAGFRVSITGFFHALVKAIHAADLLFGDTELMANIQIWVSTMSAAQNRPFRHTATVVALSITSALCEVGRDLLVSTSKAQRHSESERKKSKVNKKRVSALSADAQKTQEHQSALDAMVRDWFETVYIHRYRDIYNPIRTDCAQALGDWIVTYPDVFFDGSHLRYLGWVLSDTHAPARLEVVTQLLGLYKEKDRLAGLKSFTERFRPRIVEMATLDSEPGVRAATVGLLDLLREAGYLEPDDIDAVGRLIFDSEPRVRKAVAGFLAECVKDIYESKLDDLGGQEAVEEELPESAADTERRGLQWLRFKCLAEMLDTYDASGNELSSGMKHGYGRDNYYLHATASDSRYIIAAEALYSHVPIIRDWEALSGYLMHDMSGQDQNGNAQGVEAQLMELVKLTEKEEIILLEVLNASVKAEVARLVEAESDKKGRKTKKQREDLATEQEEVARNMAGLIPQLLKKFGDRPKTASVVLRLERIINLEAFEALQHDTARFSALLDDINKQFMRHGSEEVLTEASRALLRAKKYHDLGEVTEEKIDELWEETISTFTSLTKDKDLGVRGTINTNGLDALSKTTARIERLSAISRPIEHLDTAPSATAKGARKTKANTTDRSPPIKSLIHLIQRAVPSEAHSDHPEDAHLEDSIALHAAGAVSFYFMWTLSDLKTGLESSSTALSDDRLETLAMNRDDYIAALTTVISSRPPRDGLSSTVAGILLDAHTIMATLRQIKPREQGRDDFLVLALEVDPSAQKQVLAIFAAAEASFAKKTGRTIEKSRGGVSKSSRTEVEDVNADPIDADAEPEDDEAGDVPGADDSDPDSEEDEEDELADADGDANEQEASQARQARVAMRKVEKQLLAERKLCELTAKIVLAVVGGMMDQAPAVRVLERNKARLGPNFREVLRHLDLGASRGGAKRKAKTAAVGQARAAAASAASKSKKSEAIVVEEDEDEDELVDDEDDEVGLRRRELDVHVGEEEGVAQEDEDDEREVESILGD